MAQWSNERVSWCVPNAVRLRDAVLSTNYGFMLPARVHEWWAHRAEDFLHESRSISSRHGVDMLPHGFNLPVAEHILLDSQRGFGGLGGDAAHGVGDVCLLALLGCRNPGPAVVESAPHSLPGFRANRWVWVWLTRVGVYGRRLSMLTLQRDFREGARSGHFSCGGAARHAGAAYPRRAFCTDIYMFRKVLGQVLILVFPGMFQNTMMMCTFVVYAMPDYFALNTGMMFGATLVASDPVTGA